jgi:hypothetical protein
MIGEQIGNAYSLTLIVFSPCSSNTFICNSFTQRKHLVLHKKYFKVDETPLNVCVTLLPNALCYALINQLKEVKNGTI